MYSDTEHRWPRFGMVFFSQPAEMPIDLIAPLMTRGVPKSLLGRYTAASELTLFALSDYGQLICFGTYGRFGKICLNPPTGQIVDILAARESRDGPDGMHELVKLVRDPRLVNSSLERFIASVQAVLDRFPFDSEVAEEATGQDGEPDHLAEEWGCAAEELQQTLCRIDPAIADTDGFWMNFLDDVRIGDFATQMVISAPGK